MTSDPRDVTNVTPSTAFSVVTFLGATRTHGAPRVKKQLIWLVDAVCREYFVAVRDRISGSDAILIFRGEQRSF